MTGVLLGLAIIGGFTVTAMLVRPALLHAGSEDVSVVPGHPDRQSLVEALALVLGSSVEVLAIHNGHSSSSGGGSHTDIVFRTRETQVGSSDQFISPGEIAMISHSRVLQTLFFYSLERESDGEHPGSLPLDSPRLTAPLLTHAEVASPQFARSWRTDPGVGSRIIASNISDVHVRWADAPTAAGDPVVQRALRLALTWSAESADGEDEAVIFVNVRWRSLQ